MRIAQINAVCSSGSTGRLVHELHDYLVRSGHECRVWYGSEDAAYPNAVCIGSRCDQLIHALGSRASGVQGHGSKGPTRRLLAQLGEFAPDVVHLHNLHANYVSYPLLLAWLAERDVPTVLTLHDCWFFTGKCTYPVLTGCVRWQDACGHCPQLKSDRGNPTWFFDRTAAELAEKRRLFGAIPRLGVVGVSDWVMGEAGKSFFRGGGARMARIYNWIDSEVFKPLDGQARESARAEFGVRPDERLYLAVCSGLSERKGWPTLCALAARLVDGERLLVVGANPRGLEVPEGIQLVEPIREPSRLAALYSAADVCVNATQAETFGLVTAEALACGTQVVVNPNTASPELVEPGCGLVLGRDGDVDELVAWLRSGEAVKTCMTVARCVASARRFDRDARCGDYLGFYEKMIHMEGRAL
jgi:glycosyltransferase involved in cell wall biosynthesis